MSIKFASTESKTKAPRAAEKILEGLQEALAVAKDEAEPAATHVRRGPKPSGKAKQLITLRLDPDVIEGFKSTGEGWQVRMNQALRTALKL